MSGVHDDLATLRSLVDLLEGEGLMQAADNLRDASEGVEAEIARLRELAEWDTKRVRAAEAEAARLREELEARDDAELIGHAQDARDAAEQRYGQGFFPGPTPMERQMADDEYSPEHQDEYQRLWHRDARRAKAAEADIARLQALADDRLRLLRSMEIGYEAEAARLRDGLRFYANEDSYLWHGEERGTIQKNDRGARARALLAEDGAASNLAKPHLDLETKIVPNAEDGPR